MRSKLSYYSIALLIGLAITSGFLLVVNPFNPAPATASSYPHGSVQTSTATTVTSSSSPSPPGSIFPGGSVVGHHADDEPPGTSSGNRTTTTTASVHSSDE